MSEKKRYQSGFGNHFSSEALPGALPEGQNSPQKVPYGLVAELLSGSAFTAKRHENLRTWVYRIRPSVVHGEYQKISKGRWLSAPQHEPNVPAAQLRWDPMSYPQKAENFLGSMTTFATNGDVAMRHGSAVHMYAAQKSMDEQFFMNGDGDLLIVPQEGRLELRTEFGTIEIEPNEIAVVQRGMKFQVQLPEGKARGYVLEIYGAHLVLPYLGPIGSSGLANARDFETPVAAYEDKTGNFIMHCKFAGQHYKAALDHSPLDVVAWHGNYAPYKYDLRKFMTINTVSFDHPDPSIFTVLTSPGEIEGQANVDFVIFPPRWMVAQNTFRPPYFHRNMMSEYMGLIHGVYDAKPAGGFEPGGGSLHNCMLPHGPEAKAYEGAIAAELKPHFLDKTLAFMFESAYLYRPTDFAMNGGLLQSNYADCWKGIPKLFNPTKR
ncbi:MAG: homogentisate 1,2-dioxygenase [Chitinophagaceae bacterium]|nr:homogentisate 1,2-dioxygenase [Oligoflexus sp.]